MDARTEMPKLALPFAVVGAAAGWLSVDFLDNPLVGFTPSHAEGLAAFCTAMIAASVGAWLSKRCAPREEWFDSGWMWVQVVCAVLAGGAVSGFLIGGLAFQNLEGAGSGILAGLGAGLAFLPVCALVVAAARRAVRARLGSLVADADRREMWGLMAMALAVTTCAALPDWLVWKGTVAPGMMAGAALGVMVALLACDLGAHRKVSLAAEASASMELREGEGEEAGDPAPDLDFGLGDEVRARVARGAAAYRGREHTKALVLGSPDQAMQAIRRALLKKTAALALVGGTVALHWLAPSLSSSTSAHEAVCEMGVMSECRAAAELMMDGEGSPEIGARAWPLAERACFHRKRPDGQACRLLARIQRSGLVAAGRTTEDDYHTRACDLGDQTSCTLLRHPRWGRGWPKGYWR